MGLRVSAQCEEGEKHPYLSGYGDGRKPQFGVRRLAKGRTPGRQREDVSMELIKPGTKIDFVGKKHYALALSALLILVSIVSLWTKGGPRYGVDFSGGVLAQLKFPAHVPLSDVRAALEGAGVGRVSVQGYGQEKENEFLVRIEQTSADLQEVSQKLEKGLKDRFGEAAPEIRRMEMVGPKVGADLRRKGFWAVVYATAGILIYLGWRFEPRFGLGAVIALIHDAIIVVGSFSVLDKEIDLSIVAAILTIIGYSVYDTVVVFDRIRENMRKIRRMPFEAVVNASINETLNRSLLTSSTTLITVVTLFVLGGPVVHDFAFALIVGVVVGTYSSIYIASPIVIYLERFKAKVGAKKSRQGK